MTEDLEQEPAQEETLPDRMMRFGSACSVAIAVAVAASLPAAMRTAAHGDSGILLAWALLSAAAMAPALLLILLLRSARAGARGVSYTPEAAFTVLVWALASYAALSKVGASLHANTHHHALAAVTFTLIALVMLAVLFLLARRLAGVLTMLSPTRARRIVFVFALLTVATISISMVRNAREPARALLDGVGLLLFAALASRPEFVRRRLALVGPPLFLAALGGGVSLLRSTPAIVEALGSQHPLFSPFLSVLGGH